MFVYTIQPVVKPVWQPVWQPAVSCIGLQPVVKPVVRLTLTTGWTNSGWQPVVSCKLGIKLILCRPTPRLFVSGTVVGLTPSKWMRLPRQIESCDWWRVRRENADKNARGWVFRRTVGPTCGCKLRALAARATINAVRSRLHRDRDCRRGRSHIVAMRSRPFATDDRLLTLIASETERTNQRLFSRDCPGEPAPEEFFFWTLRCKGRYQRQTHPQSGWAPLHPD